MLSDVRKEDSICEISTVCMCARACVCGRTNTHISNILTMYMHVWVVLPDFQLSQSSSRNALNFTIVYYRGTFNVRRSTKSYKFIGLVRGG